VVHRSEGMNLSPVELAVPMSEQTPTAAGHGLDLLGPVVIEGSPEALQTVAMPAPFTSQIVSDTSVADVETDELTETLNTTIVPTPAMHLAPPPVTFKDPCSTDPTYGDHPSYRDPLTFRDHAASTDPSLAPNVSTDPSHKRGLCRHAVSVRVCVCVSRLWILSKRINYTQNFYTIGEPNHSIFSTPNGMAIFLRGSPNGGVECRWGRQK